MEIKKYDPNGVFMRIVRAAKAANEAQEILYGVELTREELEQLKAEFDTDTTAELTEVPMIRLPIIVDGVDLHKQKVQKLRQLFESLPGLDDDDSPPYTGPVGHA